MKGDYYRYLSEVASGDNKKSKWKHSLHHNFVFYRSVLLKSGESNFKLVNNV